MATANEYTASVGGRVKQYRKVLELNQAELADRAGISQPTVSRIEKGDGPVDGATVLRLASSLQVGLEALLGPALMQDKVVTAGRPADDTSTMEIMRSAARDYLADFRRVTASA